MSKQKQPDVRTPVPPDQALSILESVTVPERARAICRDIDSGKMQFASVDPFDLAHLLEVPQPEMPENSWHFVTAAEVRLLEAYFEEGCFDSADDLAYYLRDVVSALRLEELEKECGRYDNGTLHDFGFLRPNERKHLESLFARKDLEGLLENGIGCTACYCVRSGDCELWFHAEIEDDGACIYLRTPYDGIVGPITMENDPNYVCETW